MKKILFFILAVALTSLSSCKKEGCTNENASNYDENADTDDGSCILDTNNEDGTFANKDYLNPNLTYGAVTDIDGNEYATIQIGTQVWMAENLKTTKYCNGDPIPNVTDTTQWSILTTGAWAHYNNDNQYDNPYGKLYNWYTVNDSRNICPCNWHVPTDAEWVILEDFLVNSNTAGGKLKTIGTQYWTSPNTDATNESGFSGLPGGSRNYDGSFGLIGDYGSWWSSTEYASYTSAAWYRSLYYDNGLVYRDINGKRLGFSVRCLRD